MREIESNDIKIKKAITVDDIVREVLKNSPRLDETRQDLKKGRDYYIGGDPDSRNQI